MTGSKVCVHIDHLPSHDSLIIPGELMYDEIWEPIQISQLFLLTFIIRKVGVMSVWLSK